MSTDVTATIDLTEARRDRDLARYSQQPLGRERGSWPDDWESDRPRPRTGPGSGDSHGALSAKRRTGSDPSLVDGAPIRQAWPYGPPRDLAGALVRECCAKIDCEYADSEWPADLENAEWQGRLTKPRDSASEIFRRYGLLDAIHSEGAMAVARMAGMAERQAKVWVLSVERGLTQREIGRELRISQQSVQENLIRAKARVYALAQRLEARHDRVAA